MTRLEAMALYCGLNSKAATVIGQLIYWDEQKTVKENARDLKISKQNSVELAKRYGLSYKRTYKTRSPFLQAPQAH